MTHPVKIAAALALAMVGSAQAGSFGIPGFAEGEAAAPEPTELPPPPAAAPVDHTGLGRLAEALRARQRCSSCHPMGDALRPVLDELFSMSEARQPLAFESVERRDMFGKALAKLHDRADSGRFVEQTETPFQGRMLTPRQVVEEFAARLSGEGELGPRVLEDLREFGDLPTTEDGFARQYEALVEGGIPESPEYPEASGMGLETVYGDLEYGEIPFDEAVADLGLMRAHAARLDELLAARIPDPSPALLARRDDVRARLEALAVLVEEVRNDPDRRW